jgi:hypothetical protein
MAKYKKVGGGTYGVYQKEKKSGCAPIIVGIIIFIIVLGLLSECSANAQTTGKPLVLALNDPIPPNANKGVSNPSRLRKVENDPRLLVYEKRDGNISPYQFAVETSKMGDRLVIFVAATPKYETQAVDHAQRLAGWLERKLDEVDKAQIILYPNDAGVAFYYYVSGITYMNAEKVATPLTPDQATAELQNVYWDYKATMALIERGEHLDILN